MCIETGSFQKESMVAVTEDLHSIFVQISSLDETLSPTLKSMSCIDRFSCASPFPFLNGVFQKESTDLKTVDATIQDQIAFFNSIEKPHIWWLINEEQNKTVGPKLISHGYQFAGDYLAYAQSSEGLKTINRPKCPPIEVKEVKNEQEFKKFLEVFAEVFDLDLATQKIYESLMKDHGPHKLFRHLYAVEGDQVIGVISGLFRNGWCGAWNGGVIKEYRGKGVGRTLSLKLLEISKEEDVKGYTGILMADAQALGLCHKFGGQKVGALYPYYYGFSAENFEPEA